MAVRGSWGLVGLRRFMTVRCFIEEFMLRCLHFVKMLRRVGYWRALPLSFFVLRRQVPGAGPKRASKSMPMATQSMNKEGGAGVWWLSWTLHPGRLQLEAGRDIQAGAKGLLGRL